MELARPQQLERLGVREALGLAPALLHQADPGVQPGQALSLQLRAIGVDGTVLAPARLGDFETDVGLTREVEDEPTNVVGHVACIDFRSGLEARHAVKHHRLADRNPRPQVIAMRLVRQPRVTSEDIVGAHPADVLDHARAERHFAPVSGIRKIEAVLSMNPDLATRLVLLLAGLGQGIRVGQIRVENTRNVVGHSQVVDLDPGVGHAGKRAARSDVVVVVVRLHTEHALGPQNLRTKLGRSRRHAPQYTAPMSEALAIHGGKPIRERPFARWPEFGNEERESLVRVLESGSWGGHPSPNREALAFSREFARYLGAKHVVPCTSGTSALHLALQAARLSPGAEVVTSAYSFVATVGSIAQAGCLPIPVDVEPSSLCLDPNAVQAAIGPRTEAILPVHLASSMADMDRLSELAQRHGLALIEDCAHTPGAQWNGRAAGTLGDFGCFSMQSSKLLSAGEGGAVSARSTQDADRLWSLVNCGRKEPGYDDFPEQMLGHNLRMTEWQAALLRAQLRRLDAQHERRSERVAQLAGEIDTIPGLSLLEADPRVTRRTHYQTILRYDAEAFEKVPRDHALLALQAEGLPCWGRFYLPINEDRLFAPDPTTNPAMGLGLDLRSAEFPVAKRAAYEETIWLPHELFLGTPEDVRDIATMLARVQAGARDLLGPPPGRRVPR